MYSKTMYAQATVFADIVCSRDIRMVQPSSRASLNLKATLTFDVARLTHRKNLHRDRAMQIRIPRAEHGPHSAAADELF